MTHPRAPRIRLPRRLVAVGLDGLPAQAAVQLAATDLAVAQAALQQDSMTGFVPRQRASGGMQR